MVRGLLIFIMPLFISKIGLGQGSSLSVPEVGLRSEQEYIRLQEYSEDILECRFKLDKGEETSYVTWYKDEQMVFQWSASESTAKSKSVKTN